MSRNDIRRARGIGAVAGYTHYCVRVKSWQGTREGGAPIRRKDTGRIRDLRGGRGARGKMLPATGNGYGTMRGGMEDGKKKESPPVRARMTCLIWAIIFAVILLAARMCVLLVSSMGVR